MSGGVGSRFWPFSTEEKPKQFLDFFGIGRSLLQSTYDRFRKIVPAENIFIVTNDAYASMTKKQLPELADNQILLEPMRRNTAPAIAYATYRIRAVNPRANIIVAPSDHLILREEQFISDINKGLDFVAKHPVLFTLGIKPNRPETGYGYIQISGEKLDGVRKVKTFTEKPNLELAKVFVESGEFFWNSGVFVWSVEAIWKAFNEFLPEMVAKFEAGSDKFNTDLEQDFINEIFPSCQNISIDYGIMENAKNVYVLCGDFGWSDLGTWGSLYDMSEKDEHQNVTLKCKTQFYESNDNIVVLPENKLAVIQNLSGYIVVESDNVLLICKKEDEQRIRHFVTDVNLKYGEGYI
ncbi:MAG TPA: mannose-1-phosphate guanylyltransferase [Paludibacteraceae bacterium]|nr:mannose-1-phosphate guanylyltransferase [Paludibacteraceae bacterium]